MDKLKVLYNSDSKCSLYKKNTFSIENQKHKIEIIDEEKLKKIEAYLEWEQEYYVINQLYLFEKA